VPRALVAIPHVGEFPGIPTTMPTRVLSGTFTREAPESPLGTKLLSARARLRVQLDQILFGDRNSSSWMLHRVLPVNYPAVGDAGHRPALRDINVTCVDLIDSCGAADPRFRSPIPLTVLFQPGYEGAANQWGPKVASPASMVPPF
jgi:hypothetical protein